MEGKFLLSICIPTYDRPARIKKSLENYEKVLVGNGLERKVEICISDNSTDAETEKIVREFMKKTTVALSYGKNEKNLGFDKNVVKALSMGRGTYLHLVSDEDLYRGDFLSEILNILEKETPDCIISYAHMRKYMHYRDKITRIYGTKKGEFINKMFSLPGKGMLLNFGLLSCVVVSGEHFKNFAQKFGGERFYGLGYMHAPIYINAIMESKNIVLTGEMFRDKENADEAKGTPRVIAFPSDQLKFVHRNYFHTIKTAHEVGIFGDNEWKLFSKNYFKFGLLNMLEIRTYIYPGLIDLEFPKCKEWLDLFGKNYSLRGADLLLFNAYRALVFNRYMPYYLVYAVWAYYRRKIRDDIDVADAHKDYQEYLEGKRKFDNLDARTYESSD